MLNLVRQSLVAWADPALASFINKRCKLQVSPYPLKIYSALLENLIETDATFPNFIERGSIDGRRVYVRHDVDTAACVENLAETLEIDQKYGIRSGVYFRLDAEDYDFESLSKLIADVDKQGFEVGVHTSCYDYDDPIPQFKRETERFRTVTGIAPRSFTLHGLGRKSHLARLRFRRYMARNLRSFGYAFSDCHVSLRKYRYVVEDCHTQQTDGQRFIYNDFQSCAPMLASNTCMLILTHPCYWRP